MKLDGDSCVFKDVMVIGCASNHHILPFISLNAYHSERSDEPSPALRDELTEGNLLLLVVKYI